MELSKEKAQPEEAKGVNPEKANKMRKCYDYMSNLKSLLTKDEYAQYLVYLKLLKDNYLKEKVLFYATVAFQIFFPTDMKAVLDNYEVRKSLFSQSKYFFPKTDRETYSAACNELMKRMDENVNAYLIAQGRKVREIAKKNEFKAAVKLQSQVYIEYQKKPQEDCMMVDSNTSKPPVKSAAEEQKKPQAKKSPEADMICMICFEAYEKGRDFAKAKCGHVACWTCWTQWLDNCLECPMCKQRTRLKQLTKIA